MIGVDVSKWQGEMDWPKARNAGAQFAYIRAGSIDSVTGVCYTDYQFERNADLAPQYMPVGYYWFMRPNHDPIRQADYFLNLLASVPRQLEQVCDIEQPGPALAVKTFCQRLQDGMIYTNRNTVQYLLTGDKTWMGEFPLWLADWDAVPSVFPPWVDYRTWQSGPEIRGYEFGAQSKEIDIDQRVSMPGPEQWAEILVDGLSLRNAPVFVDGTLIGRGIKGKRLLVGNRVVNGYREIIQLWGWDASLKKVP